MAAEKIMAGLREAADLAAGKFTPGQKIHHGMVTVEITHAGPRLYVGDVLVRTWLGCDHDAEANELGHQIGLQIWNAAVAD